MRRLWLIFALVAAPLMAQPAPPERGEIQKLVILKYADPQAIENLLRNFGILIRVDPRLKVITLAGPSNRVTTAEDAIKQLDIPAAAQKDIDLTVYFVVGTDQSNFTGNPIPADLQSTVAALKSTFAFKTYGLLDVLSLRTRSGAGAETSGQFGSRFTTFRVRSASLEGNGMIRLDYLHAGVRNPVSAGQGKIEYVDTGISTDVVDVREGQKLVVGRSSLDGPEKALFLVLIAKVAQ
jgi:Bacterial type II/III secretion system short domain